MKAAYLQNNHIHVGEVPDPVPSKGQALVRTHTCGLCASDAHFLHGGDAVVEMSRKFGGPYAKLDLGRVIVMGHEYVGEILDYGPGSRRPLKTGTRVTSQPVVRTAGGHSIIGQSHDCPGGFCLVPEEIYIPNAQSKRLKINFAAGEEQQDLDLALRSIADGKIDITPWLGGRIGLAGVAEALDAMSSPTAPVRTVVDPRRM